MLDELREAVRNPTDEQKAIAVAIATIFVVNRLTYWYGIEAYIVRSTMAVGAGFAALFAASYLITGHLVPPDENDPPDGGADTGG
jgi:hypothetical protein